MKIVSWNCNYGLTESKIIALQNSEYGNADITAIQEIDNKDYIQQVIRACEDDSLKSILFPKVNNAIWLGDFNSSLQLRQEKYKNLHQHFLDIMESCGYKSAWHLYNNVEHGKERAR